ncbi:MAG: LysR family transcriptional regulator [Alicyclobacillaceae bacterium]|nr:LysR family transcriptional regulator [Alicyclobacillaceae bacterium]
MDNQLLVFVTVAQTRNFSRAAEELHLTQPAVSLHIQALEKRYGVKLFDRTNRMVRLTRAGEILYHHAREILNRYAHIERLMDDLTNRAAGPLAIGASYTFGEYVLPGIIAEFCRRYPGVAPTITIENTSRVAEQIIRYELDVGIVEGNLQHADLEVRAFARDEMVVIVSARHPLAGREEVEAGELREETWIVREPGSGTREATDRMFADLRLSPASVMEFSSNQIIKESVEAGLGVSLISRLAIRKEIMLGTLVPLRLRGYPVVRSFSWVVRASQFRTKVVQLFLEFLSQTGAGVMTGAKGDAGVLGR